MGAAYWFTNSTSFANPAFTIGRIFADTFSGIAPASVPAFMARQLIGLIIRLALTIVYYPDAGARTDDVVASHQHSSRFS